MEKQAVRIIEVIPAGIVRGCPFCGNPKLEIMSTSIDDRAFVVHCGHCCARGPIFRGDSVCEGMLGAISRWNVPDGLRFTEE